jgi:hypothetical protein
MRPNPTVDEPTVVANLEPAILDCLHEVQVLAALHLAKDDVTDDERPRIGGSDGA